MISKEKLAELFEGKLDILSDALNEKAENSIADIVGEVSEALLSEMTPGHKAMMKQHLDNVDIVDYTDEFGKPTKPKKTQDPRIKNIKRPDDRDAYNQLDDFQAAKSGKNTNFVGKTYTTNERALRSESVESEKEYQDKIGKWAAWKMQKQQAKDNKKNLARAKANEKPVKEDLDEGMMKDIALATNWHGSGVDSYEKAQDRKKARKDSIKKFFSGKKKEVKEDVEQLDELSRGTLASYASKSIKSKDNAKSEKDRAFDHHMRTGGGNFRDTANRLNRKIDKREKGVDSALKRLAKEEVEPLEELSQEKLAKYKDHASAQILRYDGKSHNTDKKFWNRVKGLNTLGRKEKAKKD
jgi:hypothetical protein